MELKLNGQKAVVTGSTAGIGLAIATALAREGAQVLVNGRTQGRVDAAVRHIAAAAPGAAVSGLAADLSTSAGSDALIRHWREADILVNNLGIFEPRAFAEITDADWLRFFETNVLSGVRLSRHYFPGMLRNNRGRIIFISSESALNIPAEMIHYGMTKTAQLAVARGLAELTAGTAVTVNSVLAGPTKSEGVGTFVAQMAAAQKKEPAEIEKEFFAHVRPTSLLKRFETPEEIANVVTFLCSPLAAGVNGASIRAEGGVVKTIA
ncbi:MAG TPA: SDR family oxidoreductase [Phycisphaerae bacterium]|jgi:NAD(P)-dependent dehydrogenase (short-subunit alcohol dehydrogenase family)|nr:SDR family oxidoreductase [Phycisphaerae bacterium]